MSEAPILAISGTPGVGKTKLCSFLNLSGFTVVDLKELAQTHGCLGEEDPKDGAAPIDIHALADAWNPAENEKIAIDGHLSHLLHVDGIVLLRCEPSILEQRLSSRGYDEHKVRSNVEWEMTAGHWSELIEFEVELPVLEMDTTSHSAEELSATVLAWVEGGCESLPLEKAVLEAIDWLS
jgi:adenylate kinase